MISIPLELGLLPAGVIFAAGLVGVMVRRNLLFLLMSLELMLNGAGAAFIVAAARWGQADGQVIFLFILTMAAVETAVGLALLLVMHHRLDTLDVDRASRMRG